MKIAAVIAVLMFGLAGTVVYGEALAAEAPLSKTGNQLSAQVGELTFSSSVQYAQIKVSRKESAALTFSSDNSGIKVSSSGRLTVAAGFMGSALITVRAAETANYRSAETTVKVLVRPPKFSIRSASNDGGRRIKITWGSHSRVSGYEVQYSTVSDFSSDVTGQKISDRRVSSVTTGRLSLGKTYYIRLRSFYRNGNTAVYSKWSAVKRVKVQLKVLMIGNSYTYYNDLPEMIAKRTGAYVYASVQSGCWLKDHLDTRTDIGAKTMAALTGEGWDYVVIQERSNGTVDYPKMFARKVKKLCELARNAGATPVLYATWAYCRDSSLMKKQEYTYSEMFKKIYTAYHEAAKENNALVADVGIAFYKYEKTAELHVSDGKHPTEEGSELAAEIISGVILAAEGK